MFCGALISNGMDLIARVSVSRWIAAVSELLCVRAGTGWVARNETTVASTKIAARLVTRPVWHTVCKTQLICYSRAGACGTGQESHWTLKTDSRHPYWPAP